MPRIVTITDKTLNRYVRTHRGLNIQIHPKTLNIVDKVVNHQWIIKDRTLLGSI